MRYLLVSEGKSDRMLFGPIDWLMSKYCAAEYEGEWANPAVFENKSRVLDARLSQAARYYPCDLAFVHRDTDTFSYEDRVREIINAAENSGYQPPIVCAVPVRMTEAWFLFDVQAIRQAADRPNGRVRLNIPSVVEAQRRADPSAILDEILVEASELNGRRRDKFRASIGSRKQLLSQLIEDYSPLRGSESFSLFEANVVDALTAAGWV